MGVDTLRPAFPAPTSVRTTDVTLIVPVYNEASRSDHVKRMLDGNLNQLEAEFPGAYELILFDDGSTDGTADIASQFGVQVMSHPDGQNHGKGASVRAAMLAARGKVRAFADADGSYSPDAIMQLIDEVGSERADIAVASRADAGHASLLRRAGHSALEAICQHYAPTDTTDTQAGAKAFSAKAAKVIWPRVVADRFAADREAMYLARLLGYRVSSIPTEVIPVDGSHVRVIRDSIQIIRDARQIPRTHQHAPRYVIPAEAGTQ